MAGLVIVCACLLGTARPALADPAGPTDYRSEIVSVDPATPTIELQMIGGDSFLSLRVDPGTAVLVVGYRGEPYLRFDADGTVHENRRSPSRWLNDDRFGDAEIPADATPDATPDWHQVADDGTYAWHDHRTHWMNENRPPGAAPGDVILEAVVPLVVDDVAVDVTVRSFWEPGPSRMVPVAVAAAILGALVLAIGRLGLVRATVVAVVPGALAATAVGVVAYRSVPAETGPSLLLWVLPSAAVVTLAIAAGVRRRRPAALTLLAVAGMLLTLWAWTRREAVVRAIVPTDTPAGLDRAVIVAAATAGVVTMVIAVLRMADPRP